MPRTSISIAAAAALVATALWWQGGPPAAEAKRKPKPVPTCKQQLDQAQLELAAARAEADAARAEARALRQQVDKLVTAERDRIRRLEEQIGQAIDTLK